MLPAGKATKNTSAKQVELVFQSTLPTGKATLLGLLLQPIPHISIHASREGSDSQMWLSMADASSFQSTLPAGEATYMPELRLAEHIFQSTLPAREATSGSGQIMCPGRISIHASCKGSDHSAGWCRYPGQYFNPRFPRGKRLDCIYMVQKWAIFQSTLPAGDATGLKCCWWRKMQNFNPRFLRGMRHWVSNQKN